MRRTLRTAYLGEKLGDILALENPPSLEDSNARRQEIRSRPHSAVSVV
jgi:hypothetical protein